MNKMPWDDVNDQFVIQVWNQIPLADLMCDVRYAISVASRSPKFPKSWDIEGPFWIIRTTMFLFEYLSSGARSLHGVCDGHSPRCLSLNQGGEQPRRERGTWLSTFSFMIDFLSFPFVRFYAWDLGMVLSAVRRQHMFVEMECFRSSFLIRCFDDARVLWWFIMMT